MGRTVLAFTRVVVILGILGAVLPAAPGVQELPKHAIFLDAGAATDVSAPFEVAGDAGLAGRALVLREGRGTKTREGRAFFDVNVPRAGKYTTWAFAYWNDTCGNSVAAGFVGQSGTRVGSDALYRAWHWVRLGEFTLSAGARTLVLSEREDGIAVDQILLTPSAEFVPVRSFRPAATHVTRQFGDDFTRSPGHGTGQWDVRSGTWRVAFSLDPNRIPNQYAFVGRPEREEAVALASGPGWGECRVAVSVKPGPASVSGVILDGGKGGASSTAILLDATPANAVLRVSCGATRKTASLTGKLRPEQWHRLVVERRNRVLRVLLDDREIASCPDAADASVRPGLVVTKGSAVFDDVGIVEAPWEGVKDVFRTGFYHFTQPTMPDPSDYLDFTDEDMAAIRKDPDMFRRKAKFMTIVGRGVNNPWQVEQGSWQVAGGVLRGHGFGARIRHWQEVNGDVELSLRFRLHRPGGALGVQLYAGPGPGVGVTVDTSARRGEPQQPNVLALGVPDDNAWRRLRIRARDGRLSARVDDAPAEQIAFARPEGGRIHLEVLRNAAEFDDVEIAQPRRSGNEFLYACDRPEADWWREGEGWTDHGGISCMMASSWIALVAPQTGGVLWNKRASGADVLVAFDVEEYTEWRGWDKRPNHTHFPYDNICVYLSKDGSGKDGYRLELNSQDRTATVLYREGKPVARVSQTRSGPLWFGGRLWTPRRSRICVVKRGGDIRLVVNGRELMKYSDPDPVPVSRIGIGGYNTRANFSNIEVIPLAGAQ